MKTQDDWGGGHLAPISVDAWSFAPGIAFLNHGSFGACPRSVLQAQAELRDRMEEQPVQFLQRELEGRIDEARGALAEVVGARSDFLAFVPNATTGVNTVLWSFPFHAGDEVLISNHGYNAVNNAAYRVAQERGMTVRVVSLPFPGADRSTWVQAWLDAVTPNVRLAIIDHVTSPTGVVCPLEDIVPALEGCGVSVLVDGAHAPGMVPLAIEALGPSFYTGNLHKWLFAPKGTAFLYVHPRWSESIRPLATSHGFNSNRKGRSRFLLEHDWAGTYDPSAALSTPFALAFARALVPGGLHGLMDRNHCLAVAGRALLLDALQVEPPCPPTMLGAMATVPLPPGSAGEVHSVHGTTDLQMWLWDVHRIEAPVLYWPAWPTCWLRISAQAYNDLSQYERLGEVLCAELSRIAQVR